MRFERNTVAKVGVAAALCLLQCQLVLAQPAPQTARGMGAAQRGGFGARGGDPRIQNRTYTFTETNEELPYAVFVSSKVSKDKKNPLIIALHGLGGNTLTMLNRNALELAEEGGYILVGPMGYNSSGWYGIPARGAGAGPRGMRGRGAATPPATPPVTPPAATPDTPPAAPAAAPPATGATLPAGTIHLVAAPIQIGPPAGPVPGTVIQNMGTQPPAEGGSRAGGARGMGMQPGAMGGAGGARGTGMGAMPARGMQPGAGGGSSVTDQAKVREMSEKDVMNVLEMICKEFNVDQSRIYLMGHSMGGAGTLNLGVKYASKWAAIGAIAPAAFGLRPDILASAKDLPVIIVQGDADTLVPASGTRPWVEKMKELGMTYEYHEIAGGDHGSVMTSGMPLVFKFFEKHTKSESKADDPATESAEPQAKTPSSN